MKTEINKDGLMTIKAETELEAYALKKWTKENTKLAIPQDSIDPETYCRNLIFNWSLKS
jgi:hypothetical protein